MACPGREKSNKGPVSRMTSHGKTVFFEEKNKQTEGSLAFKKNKRIFLCRNVSFVRRKTRNTLEKAI